MPKITLEALNKAVAAWPSASDICWALSFVTTAATLNPWPRSMTTSVLTAPVNTRDTVPLSALRVENLAPCRSVATTMDEDLTSAKACTPTPTPRFARFRV